MQLSLDKTIPNLIDERYELVALVFRLAEKQSHSELRNDHQKIVYETFKDFKKHPIVLYTKEHLDFSYDAVLKMAIHLKKIGDRFDLIGNHEALIFEDTIESRWTNENIHKFVELLNDFYKVTNYSTFFKSNTDFYMEHSKRFYQELFDDIDFEWFKRYGINPDNQRIILSPTDEPEGYGASISGDTPSDTIVYSCLAISDDYSKKLGIIVHEYMHFYCNPLGVVLYKENDSFKKWVEETTEKTPYTFYNSPEIIASEYLVRAYTIFYMIENGLGELNEWFEIEKSQGFTYIEEVYDLIKIKEKYNVQPN